MDLLATLDELSAKRADAGALSPLVLAYIGDSVFDLAVRTMLCVQHDTSAHKLHLMATKRVKASAQALAAEAVMDMLSEQEAAVFKRARNANFKTVPKNATIGDYAAATGFEAVLGYVFLKGDQQRLLAIIERSLDSQPQDSLHEPHAFKK